jgi:hypothetical protein
VNEVISAASSRNRAYEYKPTGTGAHLTVHWRVEADIVDGCQGNRKTAPLGKDFHTLYTAWCSGAPASVLARVAPPVVRDCYVTDVAIGRAKRQEKEAVGFNWQGFCKYSCGKGRLPCIGVQYGPANVSHRQHWSLQCEGRADVNRSRIPCNCGQRIILITQGVALESLKMSICTCTCI